MHKVIQWRERDRQTEEGRKRKRERQADRKSERKRADSGVLDMKM